MVVREMKLSYRDTGKVLPFSGKAVSSLQIARILRQIYEPEEIIYRERFYALYFNNSLTLLGFNLIGVGGINQCPVDTRIIMQGAVLSNATTVVISHNHPSGNPKPSEADLRLTKNIAEACSIMDIKLLDHIIITETEYYSFSDQGQI